MSRTLLAMADVFHTFSLLLIDSTAKGSVLMMLAALVVLLFKRDSAATRHFVWLLALSGLLVLPVLSALLPQWRALPEWTGYFSGGSTVTAAVPISGTPTVDPELRTKQPFAAKRPLSPVSQFTGPDPRHAASTGNDVATVSAGYASLSIAVSLVWALGFCLLIARLIAARWMLGNTERQATVLPMSTSAQSTADPIVATVISGCSQFGIGRPITVLIHPDQPIPVVWGIVRHRLLLPAAARRWEVEQLRSVVLHELGHIQRRDTASHLLSQIACAWYWFNPLVWLASWRLGVERERACDDLVLASGVRPSAYASHLLDVVTTLASPRWTHSCGLAMARKSSLEGRLEAVLRGDLNRRRVTGMLAAGGTLLVAVIGVPLAMLHAAEPDKPQPKAETAAVPGSPKDSVSPKDENSRPLFEDWKTSARTDGKIPGGRIGEMVASLKTFIDLNPGHEQSLKLEPILKKCDATRDWTPAAAAALLDEIAAITPRAEWATRTNTERVISPGKPLPEDLVKAPWGPPEKNGLRYAWLLEPRTETQALDSVMKSRVLFHNAGKSPVCFATEDWVQSGAHSATDASGKAISVWATERMGIRLRKIFRLAPGEYAEVTGHGLGVGSHQTASEKSIYNVGCWIEAKLDDDVTFTPAKVPVTFQTWQNNEGRKESTTVWQEMITVRVAQESPMPATAADRELLLRRVTKSLLGTTPSAAEIAQFVGDNTPEALAKLTARLQAAAAPLHFAGELTSGVTKFRVTAAVPKKAQTVPGNKSSDKNSNKNSNQPK